METTIKYLWKASSSFTCDNLVHFKIKTNLLENALLSSKHNYKHNVGLIGSLTRCQYCHTEWSHQKYTYKNIKPKRTSKRLKRKFKLLLADAGGKTKARDIRKAKERMCRKIVMLKCNLCNKTNKVIMAKDEIQKSNSSFKSANVTKKHSLHSPFSTPHNIQKSHPVLAANSFQPVDKMRKLQKLFYLTPDAKISGSPTNISASKTASNTPVLGVKNKKQKDRFAGLLREACIASSTPKQNNNLEKLLREKNVK